MAFINKDGLQHLTNNLVKAENIKVASIRGSNIKEVIDNIQRECDNVAQPNTMQIENNVSIFKAGQGNNVNVSSDVEDSITQIQLKGKTFQNLYPSAQFGKGYIINSNPNNPNTHLRYCINKEHFIYKPQTVYTFIIKISENTLTGYDYIFPIDAYQAVYSQALQIQKNQTGIFHLRVTTKTFNDGNIQNYGFQSLVYVPNGKKISGRLVVDEIILLEGDYTQTPIEELPAFFESIKSSFENNAVRIETKNPNLANITTDNYLEPAKGNFDIADIEPGEYTLSLKRNDTSIKYNIKLFVNGEYKDIENAQRLNVDCVSFKVEEKGILRMNAYTNNIDISEIMLVKGVFNQLSMPGFVPYNIQVKTIDIKEPLRSLPNGTCDEIKNDNGEWKLIRRIGKITLNGSNDENWSIYTGDWVLPNSIVFSTSFPNAKGYVWRTYKGEESICDKIPSLEDEICRTTDILSYTNDNTGAAKRFRIPKSYLNTQDVAGFKQWLSQNPITIYYELSNYETTSIEHLELYISQGTTINLNSDIAPYSTHTVILNRSGQIEQGIELIADLRNKIDKLEREYDNSLLNTQLKINDLKLNLKLKGDK